MLLVSGLCVPEFGRIGSLLMFHVDQMLGKIVARPAVCHDGCTAWAVVGLLAVYPDELAAWMVVGLHYLRTVGCIAKRVVCLSTECPHD